MDRFTLVRIGKTHAGALADLSRETFRETFAPYNTAEDMTLFMEQQFTRQQLMEEVGQEGSYFTMAFAADIPAGYVKTRAIASHPVIGDFPSLEIARIYSLQKYWGSGLGRQLMQAAMDQATLLGFRTIWLGVWAQNTRAIRFYEKWGFAKVGEQEFLLGNDRQRDWLMRRDLP